MHDAPHTNGERSPSCKCIVNARSTQDHTLMMHKDDFILGHGITSKVIEKFLNVALQVSIYEDDGLKQS